MSNERPTFSPMWHRVRVMTPRLRPHVQITRQHYRGRRWHVVHDPASNQFYRLAPIAHEFVGLLDGRRTVEEVWNLSLERHADAAPTQPEIIELLSQLYNSNLLSVDASPEVEQLLQRGRERTKKRVQQQALGLMYFRLRLFNPDRLVSAVEPVLRPVLNRWGFLLWCAWIVAALIAVLPRWDGLTSGFESAIAPSNWGWLIVVFVITKAWHELGHAVLCRRFGGQVPEFGVMLLVLFPSPYVDASACWAFPSKWQRMAVGAGGMMFELALAGAAAWIWLNTPFASGHLVHQLAYNAMLTASVSTVLFNANPLMRFDGYYILSDLLEVPNLMQRSMKMLLYLCQRYYYRIRDARPPSSVRSEQLILVVFGLAALAYRLFLFVAITLYVMGQLFAIGLFLAVWTAAAWFIIPLAKFVHWLATSPQLSDGRSRAVLGSIALAVGGFVLLGLIPVPDHRRASGVVESRSRSGVYFVDDGFVEAALVRPGEAVRKGDVIVTCRSPELENRLRLALAELAEFEALERSLTVRSPAGAQIARERIKAQNDVIVLLRSRLELLTVRAPHDGVLVPTLDKRDPQLLVGAFVHRGDAVCEVVDPADLRIAASLTTAQAAPLFELPRDAYSVEMRLVSTPGELREGGAVTVTPGQRRLAHGALSAAGGGVLETEQDDRTGLFAKRPQFTAYIDTVPAAAGGRAWAGAPGERVVLRFELPSKPLLVQWIDRLQKMIQGRADI